MLPGRRDSHARTRGRRAAALILMRSETSSADGSAGECGVVPVVVRAVAVVRSQVLAVLVGEHGVRVVSAGAVSVMAVPAYISVMVLFVMVVSLSCEDADAGGANGGITPVVMIITAGVA
jgi:hypothetical protein